jgi:homoserine kinase
MAKYTALKDFYKVSEDKNYKIGDEIELLEDNAAPLLLGGFVVAVKVEVKKPKK